MGDFKSLPLIAILTIYFFLFLTITVVADGVEMDNYYTGDIVKNGSCITPRVAFDDEFNEYESPTKSRFCKQTRVAYDEQGCGRLDGCTWENETTFFFFNTGNNICGGTINKTFLGDEIFNLGFGSINKEICFASNVKNNATRCYDLGCTWTTDAEDIKDINSRGTLLKTLGALFTFRYDFGFSGDLATVNIIINFFLFYLPLLLLIGAIYFLIPLIH